jgi:hypothetical protein
MFIGDCTGGEQICPDLAENDPLCLWTPDIAEPICYVEVNSNPRLFSSFTSCTDSHFPSRRLQCLSAFLLYLYFLIVYLFPTFSLYYSFLLKRIQIVVLYHLHVLFSPYFSFFCHSPILVLLLICLSSALSDFFSLFSSLFSTITCPTAWFRSRDSVDGIATGYGLNNLEVGVRVLVGSRIFSSPRHPDRLWGPPSALSNGYRRLFLRK